MARRAVGNRLGARVLAASNAARAAVPTLAPAVWEPPSSGPPVNSVAPSISGTARVGQTLTVSNGTWSGSPTYEYQWEDDGVEIGGATAQTFELTTTQIGGLITCVVTATNDDGSDVAESAATSAVLPLAPTNSVLPAITGTATVGQTLTASNGTWANTPSSYTYQWEDDGVAIGGATAQTFELTETQLGGVITVVVTATNAGGSNSAESTGTAAVGAGTSDEATQFLERIAAQSSPREAAIIAFIDTLVDEGIWAELDAIYLLAAAESATALTNLKSSSFNCTAVGAPTFTADVGYTAASGKYLNTGFNPTTASSPNFLQNDACVFAKTPTNNFSGPMFGYLTSSSHVYLQPTSNTAQYHKLNCATNSAYSTADEIGLWHINRTSSTVQKLSKDGTEVHTGSSVASSAPINDNFTIGRGAGTGAVGVISVAGFGGALTTGQITALDTAIDTYMASL